MPHMWKSEDNSGADSLLPLVSFGDQYQVSRLAQKHLYKLSHLVGSR